MLDLTKHEIILRACAVHLWGAYPVLGGSSASRKKLLRSDLEPFGFDFEGFSVEVHIELVEVTDGLGLTCLLDIFGVTKTGILHLIAKRISPLQHLEQGE